MYRLFEHADYLLIDTNLLRGADNVVYYILLTLVYSCGCVLWGLRMKAKWKYLLHLSEDSYNSLVLIRR